MGFFNPEAAQQALICMEMMDFEGKDIIMQRLAESAAQQQQMMQAQMAQMQQAAQMQQMAQAQQMAQGAPGAMTGNPALQQGVAGGGPVPQEMAGDPALQQAMADAMRARR